MEFHISRGLLGGHIFQVMVILILVAFTMNGHYFEPNILYQGCEHKQHIKESKLLLFQEHFIFLSLLSS